MTIPVARTPRNVTSVAAQPTTRPTEPRNQVESSSPGATTNTAAATRVENTPGSVTSADTQTNHIATNPTRGPNASLTHR